MYDGVIGLSFSDFKEDSECYVDSSRKIVTISSEEAIGICNKGVVVVIFNMIDETPMVILEKSSIADEDLDKVEASIKLAKVKVKDYVIDYARDDNDGTISISLTRSDIYGVVDSVM